VSERDTGVLSGVERVDRRPAVGYAAALLAATLFAVNGTVGKVILEHGVPWTRLSQLRVTFAFLVLLAYVAIARRERLRLRRAELGPILLYGVLGIAVTQGLYLAAIQRMPIGIALLLEFTAPIMVALWCRFGRREPVRDRVFAALVLALVGLALVAQVWRGLTLDPLGVVAALGAAVGLAFYFLQGERLVVDRDPVSLTMWGFAAASLAWALLAPWWTFPWSTLSFAQAVGDVGPELSSWSYVAWFVVLGTVAPFALVLTSLRHLRATQASVIGMTEPVIASVVAWGVLGESFAPVQILGAGVVLVGIVLAETAR
jgi:drug/metabolite transporter (DMT)-like permease